MNATAQTIPRKRGRPKGRRDKVVRAGWKITPADARFIRYLHARQPEGNKSYTAIQGLYPVMSKQNIQQIVDRTIWGNVPDEPCHDHSPVPLFEEPTEANSPEAHTAYENRKRYVRCQHCGNPGVRSARTGAVRWEDRPPFYQSLEMAREWSEFLKQDRGVSDRTGEEPG